jgi:hypothetical protein
MIAWMTRDIRQRFTLVERLISYHDTEVHTGSIYRACGWEKTRLGSGGVWGNHKRPRITQSSALKQRWEKVIRPPVESGDMRPDVAYVQLMLFGDPAC